MVDATTIIEPGAYSFASPYVLSRLVQLKDGMLGADARKKYCGGNIDGDSQLKLLLLQGI
jgi:hypothetical protein